MQVVGLDWKWLFIYPDLGIATVNDLAFPERTSVALELTTDTVMQSFLVSALAGQVYAMPGMRSRLHLLADAPGTFEGENTQFNGTGFPDQKFNATAMTADGFDAWVAGVREKGRPLTAAAYAELGRTSTGAQARTSLGNAEMPDGTVWFSRVPGDLFATVLGRYGQGTPVPPTDQPGAVDYAPQSPSEDTDP